MVSSGNEWAFVVGYIIANGSSVLYNKEIVLPAIVNGIKYIHDGAGSQPISGWGQQTWGQQTPAQHSVQQVLAGNIHANSPIKNHAKSVP